MSLQHKLSVMDADLEKAEARLAEAKAAQQEGDQSKTISEGLQRKIQLLEEELDAADKNLKDAMEKCVVAVARGPARRVLTVPRIGCGRWTSRRSTLSARCSGWSRSATSGRRSTRCATRAALCGCIG